MFFTTQVYGFKFKYLIDFDGGFDGPSRICLFIIFSFLAGNRSYSRLTSSILQLEREFMMIILVIGMLKTMIDKLFPNYAAN